MGNYDEVARALYTTPDESGLHGKAEQALGRLRDQLVHTLNRLDALEELVERDGIYISYLPGEKEAIEAARRDFPVATTPGRQEVNP